MSRNKVLFYRTLWGVNLDFKNLQSVREKLASFKKRGFNGVEIATGFFPSEHKETMKQLLGEVGLKCITQIHTMGYPVQSFSVNEHFEDFKAKVEQALEWSPDVINSHTGRDDWSKEDNFELFEKISNLEHKLYHSSNVICKIVHETHRQRVLYSPSISYAIMKQFPYINFAADLSHWVVVNGRLCDENTVANWKEILEILSKRTVLIHARVSTTENIQAIDPFSKDNTENRIFYETIWKQIYKNSDSDIIYVDPEYGPYPYASVDANTDRPYIDVEEVVDKSLEQLKRILV